MANTIVTGLVKVKIPPKGEEPEDIRAAWVGLTLPAYPLSGFIVGTEVGIISGEPEQWAQRFCVLVPQVETLLILEKERPEAWKWWDQQGFPKGDYFVFGENEVEIFDGVTQKDYIKFDDF